MDQEFSLSENVFNVLNSLDSEDKENTPNYDYPPHLANNDDCTIDEFLNFNINKTKPSHNQDFINFLDEFPKLDFNGMNIDKPIDVVVGSPDTFTTTETIPDQLFEEEVKHEKYPNLSFTNSVSSFNFLDQNNSIPNKLEEGGALLPRPTCSSFLEERKDNFLEKDAEERNNFKNDFTKKNLKENPLDPLSNLHYVRYESCGERSYKIWQCGICNKEFRHQYTLSRHLPTHTDERNYKCETCGKAFRQMSTLSQHRAIHSDARPYVCEFCRKTFNRISTLISHKKTHSEMKPHKCNTCGKAFHQKGNLRNHIFTHTNERPYKCNMCPKGFNQMSNLMCHKTHAHGEKGFYPCELCREVFNRRFALRSHEEYVHGIKYPSVLKTDERKTLENKQIGVKNSGFFSNIPFVMKKDAQSVLMNKTNQPMFDKNLENTVIIDPIKTKAMETALRNKETPFALLKPSSGFPALVKVLNINGNTQQMLVPATAEDLKSAGKVTVAPGEELDSVKAVQIKVPVVASVIQTFNAAGEMQIKVEPPDDDESDGSEDNVTEYKKSDFFPVSLSVDRNSLPVLFADDELPSSSIVQDIDMYCGTTSEVGNLDVASIISQSFQYP